MTFASAFVLLAMSSIMVFASGEVKTEAGKTVTVSFDFTDAAGMAGTVELAGDSVFTSTTPAITTSIGVNFDYNANNGRFVFSTAEAKSGTIDLVYTVKSDAKAGQECDVTLTDLKKPAADFSKDVSVDDMTVTVVIADSGSVPTPTPSVPTPTPSVPTPTPSVPTPTPSVPTATPSTPTQAPSTTATPDAPTVTTAPPASKPTKAPVVTKIDYSELLKQIEIAEGLSSKGYTKESWAAMMDALADAKAAKKSTKQAEVDAAAEALADAIAALVKVDYSKLQAAIKDANELTDSDELAKLWKLLFASVSNGELLLTSDDQKAVDAAADDINALIKEIKDYLASLVAGEQEEKEEPGEIVNAEPEGDYCNIPMHKVWPILFFVSLAVNALLGGFVIMGKKKSKDSTPLVDYEISDDDQ